jgi:hypothetical protein
MAASGITERLRLLGRALVSVPAVMALAAPPLTAVLAGLLLGRGTGVVLSSGLVRGWVALAAVAALAAALAASARRDWPRAALLAGVLVASAQLEWSRAARFEGEARVGEDEEAVRWRRSAAGALGSPPELGAVEFPEGGALRFSERDGTLVRVGDELVVGGAVVRLAEIGFAPSFQLRAPDGAVFEEGFVELSERDGGFIELPSLPHRFYFTSAPQSPGEATALLHLRVQRGKLALLDHDLRRGEWKSFDGLSISWGDGPRWARLEVEHRSFPYLLAAGAALILQGGLAAWVARRGA